MNAAKRDCSVVKRKRSPVFWMWRAVVLLDERLDAAARLPGRLREPPGKEHVVLGLEPLQLGLEPRQIPFDLARRHRITGLPLDEEPDERQPQLPRVGHRPIVNQHLGRVGAPDDLEHLAQPLGVGRPETARGSDGWRRFRFRGTRRRRARARARARSPGTSSAGKTSVIENGCGVGPNSASCSSGSSDASSSSVGCSGRSAYGQNRSSGRYFGASGLMRGCW